MWEQSIVEHEFDDGWRIIRPIKKKELEDLGRIQGHCAGHHSFWTDPAHMRPYQPLEYMFVLVDPEGDPRITAHCKLAKYVGVKHPLEKKCEQSGVNKYMNNTIHSTYYDYLVRTRRHKEDIRYYQDLVDNAKANYEYLKNKALAHGPLGRDNPLKYDMDNANRRITEAQNNLDKIKTAQVFNTGTRFQYKKREIVVISVTGRGMDYTSKEKYTNRFLEFAGEVS